MPPGHPNYALRRGAALVVLLVGVFLAVQVVGWILPDGGGEAASSTSSTTESTVEAFTLVAPPECAFGETTTESPLVEDWQQSIVDTDRRLPADYVPTDLASASTAGFDESFQVREFVAGDLAALREAAEANGTPIEIEAAYRSVEAQQDLFARREAEFGFDEAAARTARPGHSEHHLGTTVDFKTEGADDVFQSWAEEPTGQFVLENAHRFGFVNSYSRDRAERTCYDFEPWHYRYFGVDLATRIHDSGLSPREYLWHWQETGEEPVV
jgi:D-alanyl-D-alanine carboxypeptidase